MDDMPERKPRLALMGEFSAGKSTLSNLLLGASPLPTKVTATRLPPVWITYGPEAAVMQRHDGTEIPFDIDDLDLVDLEETRLIRLSMESETLHLCDLIDMPGISDPNMSSEVWQPVLGEADHVVWCTHATQAWRQSEAATWKEVRDQIGGDSLLLVTQIDKLTNERDRARVLGRLRKETGDLFAAIYPVSLISALQAGEDAEAWNASGAAAFTEHLVEMLLKTAEGSTEDAEETAPEVVEPVAAPAEAESPRVMPKRVRARADGSRSERLPRRESTLLPPVEASQR